MKLIIAGSRTLSVGIHRLNDLICLMIPEAWDKIEKLVHGGCSSGIDKDCADLIKFYAEDGCNIPNDVFFADWEKHGKAAGPLRNKVMAEYADALLVIWDGESRGSKNMLSEMKKLGKPVYEVILRKHNV